MSSKSNPFIEDESQDEELGENWVSCQDDDENTFIKATDNLSSLEQSFLGYNDPGLNKVIENCSKNHIKFKDLVALEDEDLTLLGVKHPHVREQMLSDFSQFPQQNESLHKFLSQLKPEEYNKNVIDNIAMHLQNLTKALAAAKIKLELTNFDDVMMEDKYYGSELALKVVDRMIVECEHMEILLESVGAEKKTENSTVKSWIWNNIGYSFGFGFLTMFGSLWLVKKLRK